MTDKRDTTTTGNSTPQKELINQIGELRDRAKIGLSDLKAIQKAVTALLAKDALGGDLRALETQLKALQKVGLDGLGLADERDSLVDKLASHLHQRREEVRRSLLGELQRAVDAEGLELVRLGDSPPSFFVAPVTIALNFDTLKATISYAREVVLETALDAQALLEGRREAMDKIKSGVVDSEVFFEQLHRAYDMVLAAQGRGSGERVDLVDLRLSLALLRAGTDRWRRLEPTKVPSYQRYQLAYQLQRLRRDQLLERGGLRLDLGAATGGSTRQKRNVLFVPRARGDGQYYLSLRFVKTG